MINAIIIDDEFHNLTILQLLIKENCPQINVMDTATNAKEAYDKINTLKPQLIFLDIKMPDKSGFDLLKMFDSFFFEVIFISSFNKYAISAFEFNALGYILKPIDYTKLINAVKKAEGLINDKRSYLELSSFIHSIDTVNGSMKKIAIHKNDKVLLVSIPDIVLIESIDGTYCSIRLKNNNVCTSSRDLKLFEKVLVETGDFIRVNRSIIVNANFIKSYSKSEKCFLELQTGEIVEIPRRKKNEITAFLRKNYIISL